MVETQQPNMEQEAEKKVGAEYWAEKAANWEAGKQDRANRVTSLGEGIRNGWNDFKNRAQESGSYYAKKIGNSIDNLPAKGMRLLATVDEGIDSATTGFANWMEGKVDAKADQIGSKADEYRKDAKDACEDLKNAQRLAKEAAGRIGQTTVEGGSEAVSENLREAANLVDKAEKQRKKSLEKAAEAEAKAQKKRDRAKLTLKAAASLRKVAGMVSIRQ